MVHSSFAVRGGAERYVRDLSRTLVSRGHEVRIFSCRSANSEEGDHHIDPRVSARLASRLPRLQKVFTHLGDLLDPTGLRLRDLQRFNPDVVHIHNWQGIGVLPIASMSALYPTCHSVHDHAICDPNNALSNLGRSRILDALLSIRSAWILRQLKRTAMLFATERTRALVHSRARAQRRLVDEVLPLAVPIGPHREWPAGSKSCFLFLGSLSDHKGVHLLLDAWRSTHDEIDGKLLIAGDGPLRADVECLARAIPSLHYLGYLNDEEKRSAFLEAGWLVFPSQAAETFGLVCAEALMAARPIISSLVAAPSMASTGSTLIFRDQEELCQLLKRAACLSDDEYAAMTSSAAGDGRRIDWDGHVDAVLRTYEALSGASTSRSVDGAHG